MSGRGYIGKISAIVTVNTADASRAFNRSGKEAQTYAQGMRRAIEQATRDAGKSFDNIFTPFQKLQRALEASRRADFNLGNTPELKEQIRTVEQLALAARQLATPLGAATKQFDGLALSVQQGFGSALSRTQAELIRVRDTVQTATDGGEAGFRAVTAQVNQTIASIRQLAEASQRVSALPTGRELAFSDPRLSANLNAAATAGQRAVALPQRVIESDPQIAQLTAQINRVSELAVAAAARVKGAFGGSEAQAAQQDYERLNAVLERTIARLNQKYQLFIDAEKAKKDLDTIQEAIAQIRAAEEFRITGDFQNARQMQDELQRVLALRDRLTNAQNARIQPLAVEALDAAASGNLDEARKKIAALRSAAETAIQVNVDVADASRRLDSFKAKLAGIADAIGEPSDPMQLLAVASRDADAAVRKLGNTLAGVDLGDELQRLRGDILALSSIPEGTLRNQAITTLAGRARTITGNAAAASATAGNATGTFGPPTIPPQFDLGAAINDPQRQLDALRSGIVSVKGQIDQLPAGLRQQFIPAIASAEAEFRRLAAAPNQSAVAIDIARQRLLQLTREAGRASEALNFRRSFGSRDAIIGTLQTQQLRGYTAQVQILQGELARVSGQARGPAVAAIARLGAVISEQMRRGTIDTEAARLQIQRLLADATRATAVASGLSPAALGRTVARAGDVGRQGFANLSLGVQQAAFAIEDFFSVTGGLDQRIRAAGNNISQLGFVLGGTTGLITGISVAIGAQLVAAIIRWSGVTEDAEKRQRELKDALSSTNSALERQRQLAEQLRDVYRDLAKSIAEAGEPERFRNERQQREQIDAVQRQQEERRRAAIEANSPQIAQQRGRIAEIDRQLETEQNAATRRRLIERRNAADLAARREIDDIERRGAENADALIQGRGGIDGARRALLGRGGPRETVQRDINAAARRGDEAEVSRLARELAVIENTISRLADASARLGAERSQSIVGGLNRIQDRTQGIDGVSQVDAASQILRQQIERLENAVSSGAISFEEFNNKLQQVNAVEVILEQAAEQARAFFDALQSAATDLARAVEQEASSRAVSQRRAANAAEAEFGPNDPRAQVARRQQQEAEAEARRTEQERQRIVAEEQRIIRQFEGQARAGRGDPEAAALARRIQELEATLAKLPRTPVEAQEQDRLRPELEGNRRRLRQLAEATPDVQRLRQQADANDVRNQDFNQNQDAVRRGMEAAITPAQQAGEALQRTLNDLSAAFDAGAINLDQLTIAASEAASATARGLAPAIAELFDAVQNAAAQGPSRAALNVADVSQAEGSRELTRLLRGDDAARNVNIAQLERQNQSLIKIIEVMTKVEQKMGVVVDLK
jgi:DNA repair exonuclease SbcCD ATPase subunit